MARNKANRKPPSRKRYDEEHPTMSGRFDKEIHQRLKTHLEQSRCSFADFVKDALGREESMVEKRVEELASRQIGPSVEDRLRCVEDLVHQLLSGPMDTEKYPPFCPRCDGQELFKCWGRETESAIAHPWVFSWKCAKCGFFIDTSKRIDPKSIRWIDPDSSDYSDKPKASKNTG